MYVYESNLGAHKELGGVALLIIDPQNDFVLPTGACVSCARS
jgi:hypothetical protein